MYINAVKVVFVISIDGMSASLGVAEGAVREGLMGDIKEATIHLMGDEREGVCVVCGIPV